MNDVCKEILGIGAAAAIVAVSFAIPGLVSKGVAVYAAKSAYHSITKS